MKWGDPLCPSHVIFFGLFGISNVSTCVVLRLTAAPVTVTIRACQASLCWSSVGLCVYNNAVKVAESRGAALFTSCRPQNIPASAEAPASCRGGTSDGFLLISVDYSGPFFSPRRWRLHWLSKGLVFLASFSSHAHKTGSRPYLASDDKPGGLLKGISMVTASK